MTRTVTSIIPSRYPEHNVRHMFEIEHAPRRINLQAPWKESEFWYRKSATRHDRLYPGICCCKTCTILRERGWDQEQIIQAISDAMECYATGEGESCRKCDTLICTCQPDPSSCQCIYCQYE